MTISKKFFMLIALLACALSIDSNAASHMQKKSRASKAALGTYITSIALHELLCLATFLKVKNNPFNSSINYFLINTLNAVRILSKVPAYWALQNQKLKSSTSRAGDIICLGVLPLINMYSPDTIKCIASTCGLNAKSHGQLITTIVMFATTKNLYEVYSHNCAHESNDNQTNDDLDAQRIVL